MAAAPQLTSHPLEVEVERLRRVSRRDRAALDGLARVLHELRRGARALKAENVELRAQLRQSRD
jgi:hypothetical protein